MAIVLTNILTLIPSALESFLFPFCPQGPASSTLTGLSSPSELGISPRRWGGRGRKEKEKRRRNEEFFFLPFFF